MVFIPSSAPPQLLHFHFASQMAAGEHRQPHFIIVPLLAQGHIIPACDMARLIASRGALTTVVLTPANLARLSTTISLLTSSSLPVRFASLPFPSAEFSLPDSCENVDLVPSPTLFYNFFQAMAFLETPLEQYLRAQTPPPTCLIFDQFQPWAARVARALSIPSLIFHGFSCFALLCLRNIKDEQINKHLKGEDEQFLIPGLPQPIKTTKAQAPPFFYEDAPGFEWMRDDAAAAEEACVGMVLNTCLELEPWQIPRFEEAIGKKIYAIGPLPLSNKDVASKAARGNKPSLNETQCLKWLDSKSANSVVYLSFGSITHTVPSQIFEIGAGLEASESNFIWVIKKTELAAAPAEVEGWLESFEKRTEGKGLVIRGWAPQAAILDHEAVGGFVTHCGWNSVLEAVIAGIPMLTWPHFADQFLNEKVVVEVMKVGVPVGVKKPISFADGVGVVGKEEVEKGVRSLMDGGEEGTERRRRVMELKKKVREAVEDGGSSFVNLSTLLDLPTGHH